MNYKIRSFIFVAVLLSLSTVCFITCKNPDIVKTDWLIDGSSYKAKIIKSEKSVELTNGLISRSFSLKPDGATISMGNKMTGAELIRAVKPEAKITLDGIEYKIGGLTGQPVNNYLSDDWIAAMKADSLFSFTLSGYETGETAPRFAWKKRAEWMPADLPWPPSGKRIDFKYVPKNKGSVLKGTEVVVHYELYDGIPLLCKWLSVSNNSGKSFTVNSFTAEILALAEEESSVGDKKNWILPNVYVETDYAFGGSMSSESCYEKSVWWVADPEYKSIVNYNRIQPSMLECRPVLGPELKVDPGKSFESFRTWILVNDSWDRERKGLAQRKMYRTIAPWVTENPIFMHLTICR